MHRLIWQCCVSGIDCPDIDSVPQHRSRPDADKEGSEADRGNVRNYLKKLKVIFQVIL